ncbi:MAG: 2-isopropylmalate synthase [Bacteroidetes bacterium QH_2_67_10]|nr:MAG: 2-isopropylmalate synthase [Bacteroidetes bacterium QH_2_67_10]
MNDDRITIFDTTLRDGEQAPGASMTVDEKVELAVQLARLGVDVIEAGFPISSPAQREAVRRIVDEVEGPTLCALARTTEADVLAAGEALAEAEKGRIHTFVPTSDVHLEAKFDDERYGIALDEKREAVLRMTRRAVEQARSHTGDVEFSAEDAGRTDPDFLTEVVQTAVEAGATTINIPDTTGYCTPNEYGMLFETVQAGLDEPEAVTFSTHCHDDLGLALANSLAGVQAGARQIECTINGIGERAGNAALEEVAMALRVRSDHFGLHTGIETPLLSETSRMVSVSSGFPVQPNKAIVGKNAFSHEAGIHQHGVLEERATYEIMRAEDVGQDAEQIRLGRHSGKAGLFSRLEKLGIDVPEAHHEMLYQRFLELADRKKEVFEDDLRRLAEGLTASGNGAARSGDPDGASDDDAPHYALDGPVDAIYQALDRATGEPHDLVDYTITSVSEGSGAQGEVAVTVRYGENTFSGRATDTDVLQASAQAYLDALNRLAAFHTDEQSVEFVTEGIMETFA